MTDMTALRQKLSESHLKVNIIRARRDAAAQQFYAAAMENNTKEMDRVRLQAQTLLDSEYDEIVTQSMIITQLITGSTGLT